MTIPSMELRTSGYKSKKMLETREIWSNKTLEIIKKERVEVLSIVQLHSQLYADQLRDNVDFLSQLSGLGLKGVCIHAKTVKDISVLETLPDLEFLWIGAAFNKGPDFTKFKNLKEVRLKWRTKAKSLMEVKTLERLSIGPFPFEDFEPISHMQELKDIRITSGGKLTSLKGVAKLKSLKKLELLDCRKLVSLDDIHKSQSLEYTSAWRCGKISAESEHGHLVDFNVLG